MIAALAALPGSMAPPAAGADSEEPDFAALWAIAKRWAAESQASPEDCVFTLRFDSQTRRLRNGYSATCEEPYRSPYYPWPEPSKPGARFSADEVERYGRDGGPGARPSGRPGADPTAALESCDLVVGFTPDGRGAAAVECYRRVGNVLGQRANTEFFVRAADRQVVSRLYERIGHLGDPAIRKKGAAAKLLPSPARREAANAGEVILQVDGKVVGREAERLKVKGRALPVFGGSSTDAGVVTGDGNLVVQYPDDDALRPGYYFGGEHCFQEKRDVVTAEGQRVAEWVYGPCALGPDQYWAFETHPPGNRTLSFGPYRDYGQCDGDRRKAKASRTGVAGHCLRRAKVLFRMTQDGTLVVPPNAPPVD